MKKQSFDRWFLTPACVIGLAGAAIVGLLGALEWANEASAAPKPPVVIEAEPAKERTYYVWIANLTKEWKHVSARYVEFQDNNRLRFRTDDGKAVFLSGGTQWVIEEE